MDKNLERALAATRPSGRIAFKPRFDGSADAWRDLVRDIVALANSGGGVVLFDAIATQLDARRVAQCIRQHTSSDFANFEIVEARKFAVPVTAIVIAEADTPIVFNDGTLYFRHGSKSAPATTNDLAAAIDKRVKQQRRSLLNVVRKVVQSPETVDVATTVRVVDDPHALALRVFDYDKTHPYRQKDILTALQKRLAGRTLNQFDMQAVRFVHDIDARPEFSHKSLYGGRQYSQKFLDWLVDQAKRNSDFFDDARRRFTAHRAQRSTSS